MIKSNWPQYEKDEVNIVNKIITSGKVNYWTGNYGKIFEKKFAKFANSKFALSISNGTHALEIALKSIGIEKGDHVIVSSKSFIASASCVLSVNATPIFSDIDLNSQNISLTNIKDCITKKTKAIILVHLAGMPCEIREIVKFCKNKKIKLIEDCSQAHGAKYYNQSVGSFGDIGTWSFCNDKIISTGGEGGMITTNSQKIYDFCASYRDHGKNFNKKINKNNSFIWMHDNYGSNYRITEMQSAIGIRQLTKITKWNNIRKKNSEYLKKTFQKYPELFQSQIIPSHIKHAWYKCYFFLTNNAIKKGINNKFIIKLFKKYKVLCFQGACPEIYLEKFFIKKKLGPKKRLKNAKILSQTSIMFQVDHTFDSNQMKYICFQINKAIKILKKEHNI